MSIRYNFTKMGMFPIIVCDACRKPIVVKEKGDGLKAQGAIVVWSEDGDIAFAHKGSCSMGLGWKNGWPYWEELDVFFISLLSNSGCGETMLREAKKRWEFLYSYGLAAAGDPIAK